MSSATLPVAGIELGGTKCILTLAYGPDRILAQETVLTEAPEKTLAALEAVLGGWWGTHGFAALGIASFGPVCLDPANAQFGHILITSKPNWSGTDVARRLAAPFAVPMAFDTDVNGAALAEMRWGAGQGLSDFAYVTVGTGVGVGLVINGKPTRGIGHCEMGHIRVPRLPTDTAPSGCPFHDDCIEGLASGTGIRAALGDQPVDSVGEDHVVWDRVASAIALLCHTMVATAGPQRIAIGGGVMQRQPHLLARIDPLLRESIAGYLTVPPAPYIVSPALGDQAGPMGPIAMALQAQGD
ncbi:ROK family protein [Sphingomonas sp. ABOLD]|uniref:fructokinase n=1 Tax=Sphingomonas trueperi TaxID=53317 RepID=A0A7X5XVY2_9SPHN|nr:MULTISPECIES: ROK family protein [Sphingomonas]NJB95923.1 fructokinase [Sphingomonas trueperi]RSV39896.1 ROK family protein [Sphingomonas sp. ABOLD]RSV41972.1 ROK family protein [Sphingomonas sp. ABOLE]